MHEVLGDVYPRRSDEIERDQPHYVGDAKVIAGDKGTLPQRFVDNRHRAQRPASIQFGPIGNLPGLENLGGGAGVTIGLGDGVEKLLLQPRVPHFDARVFERADAEPQRRRMKLL
jgi:hypothetical protein